MKKVAILPNIQKDKGLAVTKRLVRYLEEKGCQPRLSEAVAELAELPQYAQTETELYQNSDLLISLGGDGTLLGIAKGDERTEGIIALNDICITRDLYKILEFHVFVNDEFVDTLLADGVIICTPTGSTAYNLSAGGPVLKADAQIIAITPISPHTLTSRPIVVSADDVVTVEVKPSREDTPFTSFYDVLRHKLK